MEMYVKLIFHKFGKHLAQIRPKMLNEVLKTFANINNSAAQSIKILEMILILLGDI